MDLKYRDYLYKNYARNLSMSEMASNFDKQLVLINRYFIKNYLPHFPADKSIAIIDIGCGKGAYLLACKMNGYSNVTGVDLSESNVKFCIEHEIPCEQKDGYEYLKNAKDSYDVIFFNDVIDHLTKDEVIDMLLVMKEALRNNGIIIVKVTNMANPYTGPAGRYIDFTHEIGFTEISLKQVFDALEFSNVMVYGAKIYIKNNPLFWIASIVEKITSFTLFLLSYLYGRKSIRIFTKNLICVARK